MNLARPLPAPLAFPALLTLAFGAACGTTSDDGLGTSARDGGTLRDAGFADAGRGTDAGVERDGGTPRDAGSSDLCPPMGVEGTSVGSVFPNLTLPDCAGTLHNLQDPCPRKAAYYFVYAEW